MTQGSRIAGVVLLTAAAFGAAGCGNTVDAVSTPASTATAAPTPPVAAPPAGCRRTAPAVGATAAARVELELAPTVEHGGRAAGTLRVTPKDGAPALSIDGHISLMIVGRGGVVVGGTLIQTADLRRAIPVPAAGLTLPVTVNTTTNSACEGLDETPVAPGRYTVVAVVPERAPGSGDLVSSPRELVVR